MKNKMSMSTKQAIKKVFEDLSALTPKEFKTMIKKHKKGDIAKMLLYSGYFDLPEHQFVKRGRKK